jgi:hypothetical protein
MTKKIKYKYQDMKEIMLTKTYFLFYSKIIWPATGIYTDRIGLELVQKHADSSLFFEAYEKLTKETIDYLVNANRIKPPQNRVISGIVSNKKN